MELPIQLLDFFSLGCPCLTKKNREFTKITQDYL
jgi:hypothetical protein